ncbi:MAG: glycosyltransferase [Bacteroidetes bacterium]|nr:glycosyltransferase [Bacteroidota bacterium]
MTISVITSTKNRRTSLTQTLTCFFEKNSYPGEKVEYIVVNDGDDNLDDIAQLFARNNFKILKNKGSGLAAGRNTGALNARNQLLLFLDDDILIESDHLQNHVDTHLKFRDCIVTAHREYPPALIVEMRKTPFGSYKERMDYTWYEGSDVVKNIDERYVQLAGLAGFSCSMTKKCFEQIGLFNEKFPAAGNEDLDFYWRASAKGFKLIYDKKNICYHNEFFNLDMDTWLERQENGMISFLVLCELFPKEKNSSKYLEYTPVKMADPLTLKMKKIIKLFFSNKYTYLCLRRCVLFFNNIKNSYEKIYTDEIGAHTN